MAFFWSRLFHVLHLATKPTLSEVGVVSFFVRRTLQTRLVRYFVVFGYPQPAKFSPGKRQTESQRIDPLKSPASSTRACYITFKMWYTFYLLGLHHTITERDLIRLGWKFTKRERHTMHTAISFSRICNVKRTGQHSRFFDDTKVALIAWRFMHGNKTNATVNSEIPLNRVSSVHFSL